MVKNSGSTSQISLVSRHGNLG